MLVGVALDFANVVGRHVFGQAIFWTEEILVFLAIWGVFVGMARDRLQRRPPEHGPLLGGVPRAAGGSLLNGLVATAMLLATCVFVVVQSWQIVVLMAQSGQVSLAAGVPKAIPHAALLVGFVLTVLAVLVRLRAYLSGKF